MRAFYEAGDAMSEPRHPDDTHRRRKEVCFGTTSAAEARRVGQQAREEGRALWENPYLGKIGKAWTKGWKMGRTP